MVELASLVLLPPTMVELASLVLLPLPRGGLRRGGSLRDTTLYV
jgi:hypothetical protein